MVQILAENMLFLFFLILIIVVRDATAGVNGMVMKYFSLQIFNVRMVRPCFIFIIDCIDS